MSSRQLSLFAYGVTKQKQVVDQQKIDDDDVEILEEAICEQLEKVVETSSR